MLISLLSCSTALLLGLSVPAFPVDEGPFEADWGRIEPFEIPPLELSDDEAPSGIPILCYHHVSPNPMEYYSVTPSELRAHLEALCDAGFYLVDPEDIMDCLMYVPSDRRPVMLTFDDGWEDNMRLFESADGSLELDPACAVAILDQFCDRHPDFGRAAVFYISWDKIPFGQSHLVAEKFNMLLDMGFSIGNHSLRHREYASLPADRWERHTLLPMDKLRSRVGMRSSSVFTMAYPGGFFPETSQAAEWMSGYTYMGRQAVSLGFLVNGAIARLSSIYGSMWGRYYISRIDMSAYSVFRLISSRSTVRTDSERDSPHDPLRFRAIPLTDTALSF